MVFIITQAAPATFTSIRQRYQYFTQHIVLKLLLTLEKETKLYRKIMQPVNYPTHMCILIYIDHSGCAF
jgi:hypothetical protein